MNNNQICTDNNIIFKKEKEKGAHKPATCMTCKQK